MLRAWSGVAGWLLVVTTASTALAQRAATQATADIERTVEVAAIAYYKDQGGATKGSCYPIRVTVGSPSPYPVRIGFFETEAGGSGEQWRASGWMAAVVAAQMTGFDPRAMRCSFEVSGRLDGPSAGALLTVAVLAGLRGDNVRSDASMTGAINPDGTIGQVGGIVHKISGAAAEGKKLVLIPATVRVQKDLNTNADVDLVAHGRELGVEVRQVSDIFAAYQALTGVELPRTPVAGHPKLADELEPTYRLKIKEWLTRYEVSRQAYERLGEDVRNDYTAETMEDAAAWIEAAKRRQQEGDYAQAYQDAIFAADAAARAIATTGNVELLHVKKDRDTMIARARNMTVMDAELEAASERLRTAKPATLDQLCNVLWAHEMFIEALGLKGVAQLRLAFLPADQGAADDVIFAAAEQLASARLSLAIVKDYVEIGDQTSGPPLPDDAPLASLAEIYRRAAEANFFVLEAHVESVADLLKLPARQVRDGLLAKDTQYAQVTYGNYQLRNQLGKYFPKGAPREYAQLAMSLSLYRRAATRMAVYYSFEAKVDTDFSILDIALKKALQEALDLAEDRARRDVQAVRATGANANLCVELYQLGRSFRDEELSWKIDALNSFWCADQYAQLMLLLAPKPEKK